MAASARSMRSSTRRPSCPRVERKAQSEKARSKGSRSPMTKRSAPRPAGVVSASMARAWRGGVWKMPGLPSTAATRLVEMDAASRAACEGKAVAEKARRWCALKLSRLRAFGTYGASAQTREAQRYGDTEQGEGELSTQPGWCSQGVHARWQLGGSGDAYPTLPPSPAAGHASSCRQATSRARWPGKGLESSGRGRPLLLLHAPLLASHEESGRRGPP
mmetsp:Transcript_37536/g.122792  ORF Transcript_37536/g.122792 Transcript_37536/m.122792 type:complete len:218 (+) Transcript_37536:704-1357(+)